MERRKIVSMTAVLVGIVAFVLSDSTLIRFFLMLIVSGFGIAYFRFDILYPFTWLAPSFIVYNISVYIFELLGIREVYSYPIILNSLFLCICTVFFYCVFFVQNKSVRALRDDFLTSGSINTIKKIIYVFAAYLFICIPLFLRSGFSSKLEMNMNGGIFGLGIVSRLFVLLYTVFIIYRTKYDGKFPVRHLIGASVLTLLISLIIGERDVFLSVAINSFFVYYYFYKPPLRKVALFVLVGLVAVVVLGQFRQITNRDEDNTSERTLVESFFGSEFGASAYNFEVILNNPGSWQYQHGKGLIQDIVSSFIPSFIWPVNTPSKEYNKKFNSRVDQGYGAGYSYLAEGYQQWGYVGVFIWSVILMIIIHFLYKKSYNTVFGFAAYIFMIALIIYAMRGDLSYVISPLFKQVFLTYLFLLLLFSWRKRRVPERIPA